MAEIITAFGSMLSPENFNGENCSLCKTAIYGEGFRLVLTIENVQEVLPGFKETDVRMCSSCGNAIKNIGW